MNTDDADGKSPTPEERERFFQQLDEQVAATQRDDPVRWTAELEERRQLEGMLLGGLAEEDTTIDPDHTTELLRRQDALQAEAAEVIAALDLPALLARAGKAEQIGSSVSGLMVWRDIDFNIVAPGLTREGLAETIRPLLVDSRVIELHMQDEIGARSISGTAHDDRYYVVLHYLTEAGDDWKIDLSFWLADAPRGQLAHLAYLKERMTPELRLTILHLKDLWHRRPSYPYTVGGYEIYDAVLEHNVRTPADLATYLRARDLPDN